MNSLSQNERIRWLEVLNNSATNWIPSWSLARVVSTDYTNGVLTVDQPNADSMTQVVLTGPVAIPPSAYGAATYDFPAWASYNPSDGTPSVDDQWGAGNGSWTLRKNKTGFWVIGVDSGNSRAMVLPATTTPGGGGGGSTVNIIRVNSATPQMDGTFDANLITVGPGSLGLSTGAAVWFWDPNVPALLPELSTRYFLAVLVPGGNYNGRPLYVRDDFNMAVQDTWTGTRTNQVQRLEFDSTGSAISDDWSISAGDDARSVKIKLNGLTQDISFFKYTCSGVNLVELKATGHFEHGLLKQWDDYA